MWATIEEKVTMFKNVLVGVDGSAFGRDAIRLASWLSGADAKLTLVHVRAGELHLLTAITPGLLDEEHEASKKLLEDERAATGVEAELVSVVAASPGAGLHRHAEEQGADLLVVGSCSRSGFGRAMLGDDTRAALNGAPCAVAVAARGLAGNTTAIASVGVAYNATPESEGALAQAKEIAQQSAASVEALEVVSIPSYAFTGLIAPAIGDGIDLMIAEASKRMSQLQGVEGRAVYGVAGEELAAFGEDVDLLVVGSRGYGPVRRLVLGSTSDYLERHARCSLLVLPRMTVATADAADSD
jgi:nucleotide-binding universal stress UspA family protein